MNALPEPHHGDDPLDESLPENAAAQGWLPIREVARRTGVNPVTLRAWERRYGLIVPQRTPKGHRLYSPEHLERIQKVITWLNRGVSVSQVKALLDAPEQRLQAPALSDWLPLRESLAQAIAELAERRLDDQVNQAMALYPPSTVCERLLLPLLGDLHVRWQQQFGAHLERAFFHGWLRSKLGTRLYHNNRQLQGPPLLLVKHSDVPFDPELWLTAWLASSADCPVEVLDWALPASELLLAVERFSARGLVLYASRPVHLDALARQLANCPCPIMLAGPAAVIHGEALRERTDLARLLLAGNPVAAQSALRQNRLI
ncbi:MerR family transcriptional regulator [Pseudomonas japonica]|uniref:MerR family transcriptional regulator n=1 Tax=Pseudomonas japonica TaxID=256466 RepID=UPI0015E2DB63|nr:MerR family transcriptional regulator [Pseudomonas japonica]MBA1244551.1 MerR family transcriptional regulator [Pseudomonas japonica]MBA1290068.1 MerR family transcriptional regulator [Pseudomonas japonica]